MYSLHIVIAILIVLGGMQELHHRGMGSGLGSVGYGEMEKLHHYGMGRGMGVDVPQDCTSWASAGITAMMLLRVTKVVTGSHWHYTCGLAVLCNVMQLIKPVKTLQMVAISDLYNGYVDVPWNETQLGGYCSNILVTDVGMTCILVSYLGGCYNGLRSCSGYLYYNGQYDYIDRTNWYSGNLNYSRLQYCPGIGSSYCYVNQSIVVNGTGLCSTEPITNVLVDVPMSVVGTYKVKCRLHPNLRAADMLEYCRIQCGVNTHLECSAVGTLICVNNGNIVTDSLSYSYNVDCFIENELVFHANGVCRSAQFAHIMTRWYMIMIWCMLGALLVLWCSYFTIKYTCARCCHMKMAGWGTLYIRLVLLLCVHRCVSAKLISSVYSEEEMYILNDVTKCNGSVCTEEYGFMYHNHFNHMVFAFQGQDITYDLYVESLLGSSNAGRWYLNSTRFAYSCSGGDSCKTNLARRGLVKLDTSPYIIGSAHKCLLGIDSICYASGYAYQDDELIQYLQPIRVIARLIVNDTEHGLAFNVADGSSYLSIDTDEHHIKIELTNFKSTNYYDKCNNVVLPSPEYTAPSTDRLLKTAHYSYHNNKEHTIDIRTDYTHITYACNTSSRITGQIGDVTVRGNVTFKQSERIPGVAKLIYSCDSKPRLALTGTDVCRVTGAKDATVVRNYTTNSNGNYTFYCVDTGNLDAFLWCNKLEYDDYWKWLFPVLCTLLGLSLIIGLYFGIHKCKKHKKMSGGWALVIFIGFISCCPEFGFVLILSLLLFGTAGLGVAPVIFKSSTIMSYIANMCYHVAMWLQRIDIMTNGINTDFAIACFACGVVLINYGLSRMKSFNVKCEATYFINIVDVRGLFITIPAACSLLILPNCRLLVSIVCLLLIFVTLYAEVAKCPSSSCTLVLDSINWIYVVGGMLLIYCAIALRGAPWVDIAMTGYLTACFYLSSKEPIFHLQTLIPFMCLVTHASPIKYIVLACYRIMSGSIYTLAFDVALYWFRGLRILHATGILQTAAFAGEINPRYFDAFVVAYYVLTHVIPFMNGIMGDFTWWSFDILVLLGYVVIRLLFPRIFKHSMSHRCITHTNYRKLMKHENGKLPKINMSTKEWDELKDRINYNTVSKVDGCQVVDAIIDNKTYRLVIHDNKYYIRPSEWHLVQTYHTGLCYQTPKYFCWVASLNYFGCYVNEDFVPSGTDHSLDYYEKCENTIYVEFPKLHLMICKPGCGNAACIKFYPTHAVPVPEWSADGNTYAYHRFNFFDAIPLENEYAVYKDDLGSYHGYLAYHLVKDNGYGILHKNYDNGFCNETGTIGDYYNDVLGIPMDEYYSMVMKFHGTECMASYGDGPKVSGMDFVQHVLAENNGTMEEDWIPPLVDPDIVMVNMGNDILTKHDGTYFLNNLPLSCNMNLLNEDNLHTVVGIFPRNFVITLDYSTEIKLITLRRGITKEIADLFITYRTKGIPIFRTDKCKGYKDDGTELVCECGNRLSEHCGIWLGCTTLEIEAYFNKSIIAGPVNLSVWFAHDHSYHGVGEINRIQCGAGDFGGTKHLIYSFEEAFSFGILKANGFTAVGVHCKRMNTQTIPGPEQEASDIGGIQTKLSRPYVASKYSNVSGCTAYVAPLIYFEDCVVAMKGDHIIMTRQDDEIVIQFDDGNTRREPVAPVYKFNYQVGLYYITSKVPLLLVASNCHSAVYDNAETKPTAVVVELASKFGRKLDYVGVVERQGERRLDPKVCTGIDELIYKHFGKSTMTKEYVDGLMSGSYDMIMVYISAMIAIAVALLYIEDKDNKREERSGDVGNLLLFTIVIMLGILIYFTYDTEYSRPRRRNDIHRDNTELHTDSAVCSEVLPADEMQKRAGILGYIIEFIVVVLVTLWLLILYDHNYKKHVDDKRNGIVDCIVIVLAVLVSVLIHVGICWKRKGLVDEVITILFALFCIMITMLGYHYKGYAMLHSTRPNMNAHVHKVDEPTDDKPPESPRPPPSSASEVSLPKPIDDKVAKLADATVDNAMREATNELSIDTSLAIPKSGSYSDCIKSYYDLYMNGMMIRRGLLDIVFMITTIMLEVALCITLALDIEHRVVENDDSNNSSEKSGIAESIYLITLTIINILVIIVIGKEIYKELKRGILDTIIAVLCICIQILLIIVLGDAVWHEFRKGLETVWLLVTIIFELTLSIMSICTIVGFRIIRKQKLDELDRNLEMARQMSGTLSMVAMLLCTVLELLIIVIVGQWLEYMYQVIKRTNETLEYIRNRSGDDSDDEHYGVLGVVSPRILRAACRGMLSLSLLAIPIACQLGMYMHDRKTHYTKRNTSTFETTQAKHKTIQNSCFVEASLQLIDASFRTNYYKIYKAHSSWFYKKLGLPEGQQGSVDSVMEKLLLGTWFEVAYCSNCQFVTTRIVERPVTYGRVVGSIVSWSGPCKCGKTLQVRSIPYSPSCVCVHGSSSTVMQGPSIFYSTHHFRFGTMIESGEEFAYIMLDPPRVGYTLDKSNWFVDKETVIEGEDERLIVHANKAVSRTTWPDVGEINQMPHNCPYNVFDTSNEYHNVCIIDPCNTSYNFVGDGGITGALYRKYKLPISNDNVNIWRIDKVDDIYIIHIHFSSPSDPDYHQIDDICDLLELFMRVDYNHIILPYIGCGIYGGNEKLLEAMVDVCNDVLGTHVRLLHRSGILGYVKIVFIIYGICKRNNKWYDWVIFGMELASWFIRQILRRSIQYNNTWVMVNKVYSVEHTLDGDVITARVEDMSGMEYLLSIVSYWYQRENTLVHEMLNGQWNWLCMVLVPLLSVRLHDNLLSRFVVVVASSVVSSIYILKDSWVAVLPLFISVDCDTVTNILIGLIRMSWIVIGGYKCNNVLLIDTCISIVTATAIRITAHGDYKGRIMSIGASCAIFSITGWLTQWLYITLGPIVATYTNNIIAFAIWSSISAISYRYRAAVASFVGLLVVVGDKIFEVRWIQQFVTLSNIYTIVVSYMRQNIYVGGWLSIILLALCIVTGNMEVGGKACNPSPIDRAVANNAIKVIEYADVPHNGFCMLNATLLGLSGDPDGRNTYVNEGLIGIVRDLINKKIITPAIVNGWHAYSFKEVNAQQWHGICKHLGISLLMLNMNAMTVTHGYVYGESDQPLVCIMKDDSHAKFVRKFTWYNNMIVSGSTTFDAMVSIKGAGKCKQHPKEISIVGDAIYRPYQVDYTEIQGVDISTLYPDSKFIYDSVTTLGASDSMVEHVMDAIPGYSKGSYTRSTGIYHFQFHDSHYSTRDATGLFGLSSDEVHKQLDTLVGGGKKHKAKSKNTTTNTTNDGNDNAPPTIPTNPHVGKMEKAPTTTVGYKVDQDKQHIADILHGGEIQAGVYDTAEGWFTFRDYYLAQRWLLWGDVCLGLIPLAGKFLYLYYITRPFAALFFGYPLALDLLAFALTPIDTLGYGYPLMHVVGEVSLITKIVNTAKSGTSVHSRHSHDLMLKNNDVVENMDDPLYLECCQRVADAIINDYKQQTPSSYGTYVISTFLQMMFDGKELYSTGSYGVPLLHGHKEVGGVLQVRKKCSRWQILDNPKMYRCNIRDCCLHRPSKSFVYYSSAAAYRSFAGYYPCSCICNSVQAVFGRLFNYWSTVDNQMRVSVADNYNIARVIMKFPKKERVHERLYDIDGILSSYTGIKKMNYTDSIIKAVLQKMSELFVKQELTALDQELQIYKDNRPILAANQVFVVLYKYLCGMYEDELVNCAYCAKTCSYSERARMILSNAARYKYVISTDLSRCDGTIGERLVEIEVLQYLLKAPECINTIFHSAANRRIVNKYISFKPTPNRLSGDPTTAVHNVYHNLYIFALLKQRYDISLVNDGDDNIWFTNDPEFPEVLVDTYRQYGLICKCEVTGLDKLLFCKTRMFHGTYGWTMVRDPMQILKNLCITLERPGTQYYLFMQMARVVANLTQTCMPVELYKWHRWMLQKFGMFYIRYLVEHNMSPYDIVDVSVYLLATSDDNLEANDAIFNVFPCDMHEYDEMIKGLYAAAEKYTPGKEKEKYTLAAVREYILDFSYKFALPSSVEARAAIALEKAFNITRMIESMGYRGYKLDAEDYTPQDIMVDTTDYHIHNFQFQNVLVYISESAVARRRLQEIRRRQTNYWNAPDIIASNPCRHFVYKMDKAYTKADVSWRMLVDENVIPRWVYN